MSLRSRPWPAPRRFATNFIAAVGHLRSDNARHAALVVVLPDELLGLRVVDNLTPSFCAFASSASTALLAVDTMALLPSVEKACA
ncbi:MAG: hypothetical protein ACLSDQ_00950 [Adlercreutzia equolifaciens]